MTQSITAISPDILLTIEQVRRYVPISHSQIYRMMKSGDFPRAINVGGRRVAWYQRDVLDWIHSRDSGRG